MTRILVTGSTGFIGRHVLPLLRNEQLEIHAAARRVPSRPVDGITCHTLDLLSPKEGMSLLERLHPTLLLHLAWEASPGRFWTAPENIDWVAATLRLFRSFAAAGGRRAVLVGTCAEYDWRKEYLTEASTALRPSTVYGKAKAATFQLLDALASVAGVEMAWGRVFFLYGPGEASGRLVSDVVDALLAGRTIECTSGTQRRDFMHVADVAKALTTVLASSHCGAVNIASGICRPVSAVIDEIARQIGRPELVRLGARMTPLGEPERLQADIQTLRSLGFAPRFDLTDGIADTIEWRKRHASELDGVWGGEKRLLIRP